VQRTCSRFVLVLIRATHTHGCRASWSVMVGGEGQKLRQIFVGRLGRGTGARSYTEET